MDIISYGLAKQVEGKEKDIRVNVLGENVQGVDVSIRARIDKLDQSIAKVTEKADKLIVNDAINIMKAHAKLNAIAKTTRYNMHNMIFDDLLDLSGVDISKSSGYTHNAIAGQIESTNSSCVIETINEVTDSAPEKVLFTSEGVMDGVVKWSLNANRLENSEAAAGRLVTNTYGIFDGVTTGTSAIAYKTAINSVFPIIMTYQFLEPSIVNMIKWYASNIGLPAIYEIRGSNDKVNWTTLYNTANGQYVGENGVVSVEFNNQTPYRYYQFYIIKTWNAYGSATNGNRIQVLELEMYAKLSSTDVTGQYEISRDGGVTWATIKKDELFYFPATHPRDNKLRLRMKYGQYVKLLNYSLTWT